MTPSQASALRQQASRLLSEARRLETLLLGHDRLVRGSLIQRPKFCGPDRSGQVHAGGGPSCRALSQPLRGWRGSASLYPSR